MVIAMSKGTEVVHHAAETVAEEGVHIILLVLAGLGGLIILAILLPLALGKTKQFIPPGDTSSSGSAPDNYDMPIFGGDDRHG
jgi:hypothetical protein